MLEDYEEFTDAQKTILDKYVTSTSSSVFALRNLPEVIKGSLFSRYSRSRLGLRSLLLKEFILNDETEFDAISAGKEESSLEDQTVAIQKAQNFYDRILDGYGDDSIGELGGAHLAVENVSMIGAKVIEDARIGGSPLEKSTRYIYFDQKVNDEYLFYKEPVLMTSAFRDLYVKTCRSLFDTYSALIPPLTEQMEKAFPKDEETSKVAYRAALRAKVLDCLRGLLPAAAMTNMGVYGNGRFFESLMQKMQGASLTELRDISKVGHQELSKVIPSFVRRADPSNKHFPAMVGFQEKMKEALKERAQVIESVDGSAGVRLVAHDQDGPVKVASALLFPECKAALHDIEASVRSMRQEEVEEILETAAKFRENRRHKSPRALEHASFTFEIVADFGVYRDLQRHRMLTQERQMLSCDYDYYIPDEILNTEMEKPYRNAMEEAKRAFEEMRTEFPEEAQYVVPMAYNIRWYFHINLRALQWLCELRSAPAGHPTYRFIAQEMARQVSDSVPEFERFLSFVDYDGHELGRLGQETRIAERAK